MSKKDVHLLTLGCDSVTYDLITSAAGIPAQQVVSTNDFLHLSQNFEALAIYVDVCQVAPSVWREIPTLANGIWPYATLFAIYSPKDINLFEELFTAGFHDVISKPLRPFEILPRLQARLRDASLLKRAHEIVIGDLTVNPAYRVIRKDGIERQLPPKAFGVLFELSQMPNHVVSRQVLQKTSGEIQRLVETPLKSKSMSSANA